MLLRPSVRRLLVPLVWLLGLAPAGWYLFAALSNGLGANPVEALIRGFGTWSFNLLLLTLSVTPLRQLAGWTWLAPARRHLGLLAFAYAALHFGAYAWLDQGLDLVSVLQDVRKRPFITMGLLCLLCLLPLAATSTNNSIKRLGGQRWKVLHRLTYAVAVLAVVHYWWLVKRDLTMPVLYGTGVALLLGYRAWSTWRKASALRPKPASAPR